MVPRLSPAWWSAYLQRMREALGRRVELDGRTMPVFFASHELGGDEERVDALMSFDEILQLAEVLGPAAGRTFYRDARTSADLGVPSPWPYAYNRLYPRVARASAADRAALRARIEPGLAEALGRGERESDMLLLAACLDEGELLPQAVRDAAQPKAVCRFADTGGVFLKGLRTFGDVEDRVVEWIRPVAESLLAGEPPDLSHLDRPHRLVQPDASPRLVCALAVLDLVKYGRLWFWCTDFEPHLRHHLEVLPAPYRALFPDVDRDEWKRAGREVVAELWSRVEPSTRA